MEYAIPIILVLVIVTAGIVAFVMNSRHKTAPRGDRTAADAEHSGGPGIGGDATPLGDSAEHAGRQTRDGETVSGQDAVHFGGTGHPVEHYGATVPEDRERPTAEERPTHREAGATPPVSRDDLVDDGEAAGRGRVTPPESERLEDRPA